MTVSQTPERSMKDIARAIGTLRQLKQQIEAVRQDFVSGEAGPPLPTEVTQFHLRREMSALDRQIRQALLNAFGEHSTQVRRLHRLRGRTRLNGARSHLIVAGDHRRKPPRQALLFHELF